MAPRYGRPQSSLVRRFIVGFFALIGFLVVLTMAAGIGAFLYFKPKTPTLAERTVLTLDLTENFAETTGDEPLAHLFLEAKPGLRDVLDGIERAAGDNRVKAIFARIGGEEMGFAKIQELRDAILAFRATGKPAIAFADSFGEVGSGAHSYYLASVFDEIWLQPLGSLGLTGLRSEQPFFRGTLDKLEVEPQLDHRSEYKTAMNTITETAMTAAHREMIQSILRSVHGQLARDIAKARKLDEAEAARLISGGPYLAEEAKAARLVDRIGYRDEALAAARDRLGGDTSTLRLTAYLDRAGRPHRDGPRIALIIATGAIQRGESQTNPLSGSFSMGADTVSRAFRRAVADPRVKAILFRIDSPGGSAVASETIWRETVRARQLGKPIIVSMGDVAGSGGYYIAAAADKIVAQPATLTGSIGVVGGKMVVRGLWGKVGVTWDTAEIGDNAAMFSTIEDFTPKGRQRLEASLDAIYAGFKERVASGRKLDAAAIEAVAKGRVWTGEEALAKGLVDALGGYATALRLAKEAAGIAPDAEVEIKLFPEEEDPRDYLLAKLFGREREDRARSSVAAWLESARPMLQRIETATQSGVLTAPDVRP
jgi:protease-4